MAHLELTDIGECPSPSTLIPQTDNPQDPCLPFLVQFEDEADPIQVLLPASFSGNINEALDVVLSELKQSKAFLNPTPPLPEVKVNPVMKDVHIELLTTHGSCHESLLPQGHTTCVSDSTPEHLSLNKPLVQKNISVTQKLKVIAGATDKVDVNLTVSIKDFDKYLPFLGFSLLLFCKVCSHKAKTFQGLMSHLDRSECGVKMANQMHSEEAEVEEEKKPEHSYATHSHSMENVSEADRLQQLSSGNSNEYIIQVNPENVGTWVYMCRKCPLTMMHSATESGYHQLCHDKATTKDALSCHECPKSMRSTVMNTRHWSLLKDHLYRKHSVDYKLTCPECMSCFTNHSDLKEHEKIHKSICEQCGFTCDCSADLDTHLMCHSATYPGRFHCFLCGYWSRQDPSKWTTIHSHLMEKHEGSIQPPYSCYRCRQGFQGRRQYTLHISTCTVDNSGSDIVGTEYQTLTCNICLSNVCMSKFGSHMKACIVARQSQLVADMQHKGILEFTGGGRGEERSRDKALFCSVHELRLNNEEHLVHHYVQEHLSPPLCDVAAVGLECSTVTVEEIIQSDNNESSSAMEVGMCSDRKTAAGRRHVKCTICYKKFTSEVRLIKHCERVHSEEKLKPVSCLTCSKTFKNNIRLRNHVREVHEGKRRPSVVRPPYGSKIFVCEDCGYITPNAERLRNHRMAVHKGILPFHCTWCDYSTSERADLTRHKWRHTGQKKFRCEFCTYRTNERWVLVNHCKKKHDIQLPKLSRNTLGLPGSLRWQKAAKKAAEKDVDTASEAVVSDLIVTDKMDNGTEGILGNEVLMPVTVPMVAEEVVYVQTGGEGSSPNLFMI